MEEALRLELRAKTKQALDADDWNGAERIREADDDATCSRIDGPPQRRRGEGPSGCDIFLLRRETQSPGTDPEFERQLLRAGHLGSVNAQHHLGVMYATGEWTGPQDLADAARWYRRAAEKGHAESQYDLGFMLLLGEEGPKNSEEGLMWLERSGEQGEYSAFRWQAAPG